jgi:hypothetical protein
MPNCPRGRGCSRGWPDRLHIPAGTTVSSPSAMGRGTVRSLVEAKEGGGARPPSPPRFAGRGTTRSVVEGRRPHAPPYPSTILRMVPLPIRCANGEETRTAHNPPIASISRADNPLIPMTFQDKQRHQPSALGPVSDSCPSRRWGGRRIQRPDVGGLWSSDEARGMDTPGVLMEVDGWPPFARRALPVRTADESHVRRAPSAAMSAARSGQVRTQGHYPEGAWKTAARGRSASSKR